MFELLLFVLIAASAKQKRQGIIYARVSTKEQAEKGYSIPSQIDEMEGKAEEMGIELPYEPVIEKESGLNFERLGLWKIIKMAEEKKIDYVLAIDLDRIGRDMTERTYYLSKLREGGAKVVTKEREWDFDNLEDSLLGAVDAYRAEKEVRELAERTQRGKCRAFKERKWIHSVVPRCYERDGDWIRRERNDAREKVVRGIFEAFKNRRAIPTVSDELGEDFQEAFDEELTCSKVKGILRNPTYAGRPRYRDVEVSDPDLAIVDSETFEDAQRIIDSIAEKHKRKEGRSDVLNRLAKEYGWGYVFRVTDIFVPTCPRCDSRMVHAGGKVVRGEAIDRYKCNNCGYSRPVLTGAQMDEFRHLNLIRCPYCGETEYFEANERLVDDGYRYEYICKHCHGSFLSPAIPNKYLRRYPPREDGKSERTESDKKQDVYPLRAVGGRSSPDERRKMVVNYLRIHPNMEISRPDYIRLTGAPPRTATRDLSSLYKRKVLGRKGVGVGIRHYLL